MSTGSPTARSLNRCRANGWRAQVVERWVPAIKRRIDLFGFGDVLAIDGKPGALLIQATTTDNGASRIKKISEQCHDAAVEWLQAGNRIEVWGWAKRGAAGKRKVWTRRRWRVWLEDGALESGPIEEDDDEVATRQEPQATLFKA